MSAVPGQRIIHPEHGDVTADIIEALLEEARLKDPVILEREQAEMARTSGQLARDLSCGRLIMNISSEAYDDWTRREGKDFFTKGDGVKYLQKHFPSTRVDSRGRNPQTRVDAIASANRRARESNERRRFAVTGKRGRWAMTAA